MTCRHPKGTPGCTGGNSPEALAKKARKDFDTWVVGTHWDPNKVPPTPDMARFDILDHEIVGPHLVLKVQYPSCADCAYEGTKVMVYLKTTISEVLRWKIVDPHFADPTKARPTHEASAPNARFPGSDSGWDEAIVWAQLMDLGQRSSLIEGLVVDMNPEKLSLLIESLKLYQVNVGF